jgi:hypothetical protein
MGAPRWGGTGGPDGWRRARLLPEKLKGSVAPNSHTEEPRFQPGQRDLIVTDRQSAASTDVLSWREYSPSKLPTTLPCRNEESTWPCTTGSALMPTQAAGGPAVPGNFSTCLISDRDGTGALTNTSLALIDRRYRPYADPVRRAPAVAPSATAPSKPPIKATDSTARQGDRRRSGGTCPARGLALPGWCGRQHHSVLGG